MSSNLKIIGIIPARGGSKGIPRKNLFPLCGKPLIEYSIAAALGAKLDRVFVSTDDAEIAEVSKKLGAEVPFLRKSEIAQDHSSVNDAILELLSHLEKKEGFKPDAILLLQPTSPLRTQKHITEAIALMAKDQSDYVISLSTPMESPYDMVKMKGDSIEFLMKAETTPGQTQRQEHQNYHFVNGAIYLCKTEAFLKNKSVFSEKMTPYFMKASESVDIDTPDQMRIAEALLKS